jgi:hypothetical protein
MLLIRDKQYRICMKFCHQWFFQTFKEEELMLKVARIEIRDAYKYKWEHDERREAFPI